MFRLTLVIAIAPNALAGPPAAQGLGVETFDQPGSSWASTLFPNETIFGGGTFVREPLDFGIGAPDTTPPLPINRGGDQEGRYLENGIAGTHCTALSNDLFSDVRVDGYLAIGNPDPFGSQTVGLLLRGGSTPFTTAYVAELVHNGGTTGQLALSLMCNHLIHVSTVFDISDPFAIDLANENYRLVFEAQGQQLVASLSRVRVVGGTVVEEPIDLFAAPGIQSSLAASDAALVEGSVGVSAFARGGNSVFFDDIEVTDLGTGPGVGFCFGDGLVGACPCGNSTNGREGCRNSVGVGARLAAQGSTSVAADDLQVVASQLPPNHPGILFAGTTTLSVPFGDGLRCVRLPVVRMPLQTATACGVLARDDVISRLAVVPGDTWYFQGWYRDSNGPCTNNVNLTHGLSLSFGP